MENHELEILERWLQKAIRPVIHEECEMMLRRLGETSQYFTREEVCSKLGISKATFHNWVKSGALATTKIKGRVYVDAQLLDAYMKQTTQNTSKQ